VSAARSTVALVLARKAKNALIRPEASSVRHPSALV
jgi:hypothetical protein